MDKITDVRLAFPRFKAFTRVLGAGLLISSVSAAAFSQTEAPEGTVRIVVKNEQGTAAANASVYLFNDHTHYFMSTDEKGSLLVNLPEGAYMVSSAMVVKKRDVVDRFGSSEAKVRVSAGDLSSVVLRLAALPDAVASIELSTLRKIGVDPALAKDFN